MPPPAHGFLALKLRPPPFRDCVTGVIRMAPLLQVGRVTAKRVIAEMHDDHAGDQGAAGHREGDPMRVGSRALPDQFPISVSVAMSAPVPAVHGVPAVNPGPEATAGGVALRVRSRQENLHGHMILLDKC